MNAERSALLVRASHVEGRRLRAIEEGDLDARRHCEHEMTLLWRAWLAQPDSVTADLPSRAA